MFSDEPDRQPDAGVQKEKTEQAAGGQKPLQVVVDRGPAALQPEGENGQGGGERGGKSAQIQGPPAKGEPSNGGGKKADQRRRWRKPDGDAGGKASILLPGFKRMAYRVIFSRAGNDFQQQLMGVDQRPGVKAHQTHIDRADEQGKAADKPPRLAGGGSGGSNPGFRLVFPLEYQGFLLSVCKFVCNFFIK